MLSFVINFVIVAKLALKPSTKSWKLVLISSKRASISSGDGGVLLLFATLSSISGVALRRVRDLHWIHALTLLFSTHLQCCRLCRCPTPQAQDYVLSHGDFQERGCHIYSNYRVEFCKSKMNVQCSHNSSICELALPSKRPKQQDVPKRARLRESIRQK
ncbi:hypothetical protein Tco_0538463 [Tanacetum coccineum]